MKNRSSSRTGLFLMELILAILFFSLSGAICIQLFVKSHVLSQNSVELNNSVLWAQNMAETFYGCNGNAEEMAKLFPNCIYEPEGNGSSYLTLFFDENFEPFSDTQNSFEAYSSSAPQSYDYFLSAIITPSEDSLLTCRIAVYRQAAAEPVYELQVTLFPDKETANE